MNYRYRVGNEDIVVSREEHNVIQAARKVGKTDLTIRNGTLGINLAYTAFFKETNEMTTEQERKVAETLKLPPDKRSAESGVKALLGGTTFELGKGKRECIGCHKPNYIPEGRDKCLVCTMAK